MYKIFSKSFFAITVMLYSIRTLSQTTIDYSYGSLGSACNVFAQPTTFQGYVHQTTLGFPNYVFGSQYGGVINLANQNSGTGVKSTQYQINFHFKKGFNYSLSAYGYCNTASPNLAGI